MSRRVEKSKAPAKLFRVYYEWTEEVLGYAAEVGWARDLGDGRAQIVSFPCTRRLRVGDIVALWWRPGLRFPVAGRLLQPTARAVVSGA